MPFTIYFQTTKISADDKPEDFPVVIEGEYANTTVRQLREAMSKQLLIPVNEEFRLPRTAPLISHDQDNKILIQTCGIKQDSIVVFHLRRHSPRDFIDRLSTEEKLSYLFHQTAGLGQHGFYEITRRLAVEGPAIAAALQKEFAAEKQKAADLQKQLDFEREKVKKLEAAVGNASGTQPSVVPMPAAAASSASGSAAAAAAARGFLPAPPSSSSTSSSASSSAAINTSAEKGAPAAKLS